MTRSCLLVAVALLLALPAAGDDPKPAPAEPWYVDDTEVFDGLYDRLKELAEKGKCLPCDKLKEKRKPAKVAVEPATPADKPLTPAEVYQRAVPSVFVLGSVYRDPDTGDWVDGIYATAWAVAADGVLVTNWHVFDDLEPDEVFAAADAKGNVYPLTDFLGGDQTADVAVVKVGGKGFAPLPVAGRAAPVASWVGVLSHPGDHFYVFTQGHVSRYSTGTTEDGERERWMGITAEYASGSSGAPVLDDRGSVVGMTALTVTIDSPPDADKPKQKDRRRPLRKANRLRDDLKGKDDPKPKPDPGPKDKVETKPGQVQMVIKLAVPGPALRQVFGK